jgi:gluconokinase
VSLKELLVFRWTGEWCVDHGIASATGLFDLRERRWDDESLALAGVERSRLAEPVPTTTTLRRFRPGIARSVGLGPDAALVMCSSDGALANLGVGAIDSKTTALTLGTSGAVRRVVDAPVFDSGGRTFCYAFDDTRCLVGGPTSSAGGVFDWLCALLLPEVPVQHRFETAASLATEVAEEAEGLILVPFLSGERAPYWYADLRGAFVGLDISHDRRHLLRAGLESIVYGLRSVSDVVSELIGQPSALLLSGGLTHSSTFRALIADIFGIEAWVPSTDEASAFGAAVMAAAAVNALPGLDSVQRLLDYPERLVPRLEAHHRYEDVYRRYRQVVDAVLPLWHPEMHRKVA